MGAVTFSIDTRLVERLKDALALDVFVETGTFHGDSLAAVLPYVGRAVSVEASEVLWRGASQRFAGDPRVEVILGDSPEVLARLRPQLVDASVLYWLDAHWCVAEGTAGEQSQCPVLGELRAIGALGGSSAILVDDARLFLAPPAAPHDISDWPTFDQIVAALRHASPDHELMVVNDVIAFYPRAASAAMTAYAREHGIDWLRARQSLEENGALRADLEAKEAVIRDFDALVQARSEAWALAEKRQGAPNLADRLREELEEKERVIQEQQRALAQYRLAFAVLRPALPLLRAPARAAFAAARAFAPKLGVLRQHAPQGMRVPRRYAEEAAPDPAPSISLVTPSFRQAPFIEATLESVLSQRYPNLEYRVQDGGSDDGTVEILQRYARRLTGWESTPDGGQANAINRAFARTHGEIMGWLNSDDLLLPGALAAVARYFAAHPEVDVVYGHRVIIDQYGDEIGRWVMPAHDDAVLSWADFVPQETLFWRRRIWDRVGARLDESFRFAMDWDLLVRFRDAGARFARLPRFLGAFRVHAEQKTSAAIADVGFAEMDRIRARALGRVPDRLEIRKAVAPYLARHIVSHVAWRMGRAIGRPA